MAQKITGYIKLQIPAGKATPAPPVGPALGQHGVNIMAFTKEFNERTKNDVGLIIPVIITVYADRSFSFITKTPPAAVLIKKACGCFAAFAFMMIYRKKWEKHEGESLCLYMILYGIERTLVEGLRTDSLYIGNTSVRVSQLLSAVLVIVGVALFADIKRRQQKASYELGEESTGGLEGVVEKMQLDEAAEGDNSAENENQ